MISTPKPPDPYQTANAQTGANRDATIASGLFNNINETNPYGSVTYKPGETRSYVDSTGKTVTVPTQTRSIALSGPQQAILDQQNKAQLGLGTLANTEIGNLSKAVAQPFDTSKLPAGGAPVAAPTLATGYVGSQALNTKEIRASPMQRQIADAGNITRDYGSNDFSADRKRVEDAYLARSNDDFARDESSMDQKLRNQGLTPGSAAYNTQFDQLRRQQTDARNQAIIYGGQEQSRLTGLEADRAQFQNSAQNQQFGQNQAKGLFTNQAAQSDYDNRENSRSSMNDARTNQFNNTLTSKSDYNTGVGAQYGYDQASADAKNAYRKDALAEAYAKRNQPLNEALALASGTQVTAPQFSAPYQSGVNAAPIADLIQQNYQARLQNSTARTQGLFGLLGNLGGAAISASDRRLKDAIERLGTLADGINLYRWTWRHNGEAHVGVMADEVLAVMPDAVHRIGGVLMVDYEKVITHAG